MIRRAFDADVPVIAGLRRAWVEENEGEPVEDGDYDEVFAAWHARERDQRITWLAELGGHPVGMLNLLVFTRMPRPRPADAPPRPTQWGYVANVYVEVGARNRGVGRALLDAATSYSDEHGFARLLLSPSERSVPLYSRAGFVPATELMVRPGR